MRYGFLTDLRCYDVCTQTRRLYCFPDDDTAKRKIKVKINEIQPNSSAPKFASVDELRSVMGNLELNPPVTAVGHRFLGHSFLLNTIQSQ